MQKYILGNEQVGLEKGIVQLIIIFAVNDLNFISLSTNMCIVLLMTTGEHLIL